ncbi:MAG TPA: hypothetical protein VJU18_11800 [Vicinamibacteria bacterium]|nr:hypothetical protein [Vicinamibacteria bacterium]
MKLALAFVLLAPLAAASAAGPDHFLVSASFAPAAKGQAHGNVAVAFEAKDPDLRINQDPAPRLKLDPTQTVLVDKQPPPPKAVIAFDPAAAKSFDLTFPILFPADVAPGASRGTHNVSATVAFFYCSKREAWCRKGTAELTVPVRVP